MGYSLRIGEAVLEWSEDMVSVDCEGATNDDAPSFGDPTDKQNQRWPSYSVWADCMRKLDLTNIMFSQRNGGSGEIEWNSKWLYPLIQDHPGAAPITKGHVEYVEHKMAAYKAAHPTHIAQYPPPKEGAKPFWGNEYKQEDLVDDPKYDSALVRGEWLLYWLRWAVANCKQPVFVNS